MIPTEAVKLCRYVRAACPQQAMDEFTPQVWTDLLAGVRYGDAIDAVRLIVARQPFVAPAEIRTEVKKIREARIAKHVELEQLVPPADLTPVQEIKWLRTARRAIADGQPVPDNGRAIGTRTLPALTRGNPR